MKTKKDKVKIGLIIFLIIIFLLPLFSWVIREVISNITNQTVNFSTTFNGVSTLFSALAFGGLIYTVLLQINELELTREEYTKSAKALIASSKSLKKQIKVTIKDQKIKSVGDLIKDIFDDSEIRKFFYKIDYDEFKFLDTKSFLKVFKGSDDERMLDSMLYKYNYVGKLVRSNYLDINDINFLIFGMLQVYNDDNVKRYLKWLDSENKKWGDESFIMHSDFRWLMEEALKKV